jgi:hypothetical protein
MKRSPPASERARKPSKGPWSVVKAHDDGRAIVYKRGLGEVAAFELAGVMRDRMSDADVGLGWNYVARFAARSRPSKTPLPRGTTSRRRVVL